MIVNENLLKGYSGTHKVEAKNNGVAQDNYNYKPIVIPTNLKENQEYTLCFKLKQFNGSGEFSIRLYDMETKKLSGGASFRVSDEKIYFNFVYKAELTENLLIYNDILGQTRGVGLELNDIILVEGHFERGVNEIVYLPHKEDVKADNQAIFPIGGGYSKRCIHSELKTSRFRPVKFGGALC